MIMRTPGADVDLTAGFLLAERVVTTADDVTTIEHCGDNENVVNVTMSEGASHRREGALKRRRNVIANSSCGLCGRGTSDSRRDEGLPTDSALMLHVRGVVALPG